MIFSSQAQDSDTQRDLYLLIEALGSLRKSCKTQPHILEPGPPLLVTFVEIGSSTGGKARCISQT